ncbi:PRC-barrel domain protein [Clostridium acetireducens DSM 10703]|uniref:PRC-barrel domain protein n=1 Tax=Clostridium acetireducens DSM 10703 TaxID=1121290 RepID=A0A1E8EXC6_9CLOT|nr:PRC-barrel domain-containing protein [Clostridium acetireducens]OFI05417.1 PRC-barrel domain protein [Clostridium acetireducens DSM 10703]
MYRIKDFSLMDVFDLDGNKVGFIKDAVIDIDNYNIKGFSISSYNFFKNNDNVLLKDIVYFDNSMIIKKITKYKSLEFSNLKGMKVIDRKGNILGIVEDLFFDKKEFKIRGLIISSGIFNDIRMGKRIILVSDIVLKDKNIFYLKYINKIDFWILPHKLIVDDDEYEKL